jgi:hypothetical protein
LFAVIGRGDAPGKPGREGEAPGTRAPPAPGTAAPNAGAVGSAGALGLPGDAGVTTGAAAGAFGAEAPGDATRNEYPHLGQRIFRPAGGIRRSST